MDKTTVITFYRVHDEFGYFSNFAKYPIRLDGKIWPTSEHYFQAQKFQGTEHEEQVRLAKSAREAAKMGRERSRPLRKDWEQVKDAIMHIAVRAKVEQHADVKNILLNTKDATIVEHTANDSYWGDGGDGSGKNMLGKILMQIRDELVSQGKDSCEE